MSVTGAANSINSKVKDSFKELEAIESEAAELRKTIEAHEDTKAHNHKAATHKAALESERDGLKGEYAEAMFDGKEDRIEAIHTRRKAIDKELDGLEFVDVANVDGYALADLMYRAKAMRFVHVPRVIPGASLGILQPMLEQLETLKSEHHKRKHAAVDGFNEYIAHGDGHAVSMERDGDYSRNHRKHEEMEAKRIADNLYKYDTENPAFDNTDELHAAMDRAKGKRMREKATA